MLNISKASAVVFAVAFLLAPLELVFAEFSDFAVEVVDYYGDGLGLSPYDDPDAVLGSPAMICKELGSNGTFRAKLVEAVYNVDISGNKVITTIEPKEYSDDPNNFITVRFDHKVVDYPGNLFGADFIVFGNSAFTGNGNISDATNLNTYTLNGGGIFEKVYVSVSQYPDGPWYSFQGGPYGDALFPTQAYFWDRENAQWTDDEMDFTRPVDPNLTLAYFNNKSAADAIDLYDGSGGGTGFDLRYLADYDALAIDPNSGCRWIQYVRLEGGDSENDWNDIGGEIDALSDVAACGDPTYPYPIGDLTQDCRVDMNDLAAFAAQWQKIDCGLCGGADMATPPDSSVGLDDFLVLVEHWLECILDCGN